jgi:peptidoglycan/xylan/chitin deacetylase (PgdA/CDA1 family)
VQRAACAALCLALAPAVLAACGGRGGAPATAIPPAPTATGSAPAQPSAAVTAPSNATGTPAVEPVPSATAAPEATSTPAPGPAQVITRGNTARRMVALTFDAGSDAGYTAQILDTLRQEGVRASFSLTGQWAEDHHSLALAIASGGHQIINHSYSHPSFTGASSSDTALTAGARALELQRTETTIYHLTGRSTMPYFRPPFGDYDAGVLRDVGADGYRYVVMWTVETRGWQGASADAIVQRVLSTAERGAIYVMHVGSESQDAAALQRVIDGLRAQGYSFGTVGDVLAP